MRCHFFNESIELAEVPEYDFFHIFVVLTGMFLFQNKKSDILTPYHILLPRVGHEIAVLN